jgi:hypothetical protein
LRAKVISSTRILSEDTITWKEDWPKCRHGEDSLV